MRNSKILKFKKNESFYIRDGWFEKALNTIDAFEGNNFFAKNNGIVELGIGSNMVKSLRYWLQSSYIISPSIKTSILLFGELILKYDKYFELDFTWFFVHYFLCINYTNCPIFYGFFNNSIKSFKKNELVRYLYNFFQEDGYDVKLDYVEDDVAVFLKNYINDEKIDNPEDNYSCPLSNLKLLTKKNDKIEKCRPAYSKLSFLIVYYALGTLFSFSQFNIEDSFSKKLSPMLIFNLDKNMYLQYLDEMRKNKLITINKTAGLNIVYFEKKLDLEDIFHTYFGGK